MGDVEALDKEWLVGRGRGRGKTPDSGVGVNVNRGDGEFYSLKEIFVDESDPENFKYGMETAMILSMMEAS